jgi:hypothetical protein
MDGDMRTLRWHLLEIGEKLRKVFHLVGSDRVTQSAAIFGEFALAHSRLGELWRVWRARQDSNLRPPA